MRRTLAGIALLVTAALGACNTDDTDDWTRGYEPCTQEDGPGPCYWDASETGNGQGNDFIIDAEGEVIYP